MAAGKDRESSLREARTTAAVCSTCTKSSSPWMRNTGDRIDVSAVRSMAGRWCRSSTTFAKKIRKCSGPVWREERIASTDGAQPEPERGLLAEDRYADSSPNSNSLERAASSRGFEGRRAVRLPHGWRIGGSGGVGAGANARAFALRTSDGRRNRPTNHQMPAAMIMGIPAARPARTAGSEGTSSCRRLGDVTRDTPPAPMFRA